MPRFRLVLTLAATLAAAISGARAVHADDSGAFVIQLGQDTTAVERYVRTPSRLEIFQVGRAPRVLQRHFVFDYANGAFQHVSFVATAPGSPTPTQSVDAKVDGDSLRGTVKNGAAPEQPTAQSLPAGALVVAGSSPWTAYEQLTMQLAKSKSDSLRGTYVYIGSNASLWISAHKLGRDSMWVANGHEDVYRIAVDKAGRILGVHTTAGTGKVNVTRVASLDIDAAAARFASLEKTGAGLGPLSTRDTVKTAAGGANLWIDYGRPAKRGRVVFGNVVPYGEVWRTGANAATQFKTDKALTFGSTVVPAGFYTLWTLPTATGWKLIVNSETGQWGTEHKADKDLYTIDMSLGTLPSSVERFTISVEPSGAGGTLHLDWDTTRASAAFTVAP